MGTTFADRLRALTDEALSRLLRARPDLVAPIPADISALAARAQTRLSVARVLDGLDRFTLEILDAARLTRADDGFTSVDAIIAVAAVPAGGPEPSRVRAAVHTLADLFLLYGPADDELRAVAVLDEILGPHIAGLGRPAAELSPEIADLVADPARCRRALLAAPPEARAVLDRLAEGPPIGTFTEPSPAVLGLLDQHLLARVDSQTVELPRELGLLLRRDAGPLGQMHPVPPELPVAARGQSTVDRAAAGQAMTAVRQVEAVIEAIAADPPTMLKAGGMGVLPVRRLAKAVDLPESTTVLLIEIASAAGLIGELETSVDLVYAPTSSYDTWRGDPIATRWSLIAASWLAMPRQPSLVGARDDRDRVVTALAPEAERGGAPALRRSALSVIEPGTAPTPEQLIEVLAWHAPLRVRGREQLYHGILAEATELGFSGLGGLAGYARPLLEPRSDADDEDPLGVLAGDRPRDPAAAALAELLPPPVTEVLLQADLTVVVPGPPEPGLAAELDLVADHESGGGAVVYRVTPASLRRALDAGYTGADLQGLFARRSKTPVPQGLTYLIDDAARTHGGLRTGAAGSYLRSDDEALLATVLADRRLAGLGLRRLAPTVLISISPPGRLLAVLREVGYAPAPEDATGAVVLSRPKVRRASGRSPVTALPELGAALTRPRLLGIVEGIRRGDALSRAARRAPLAVRAATGQPVDGLTAVQAHSEALAVLAQAVRERVKVWVGYVDAHGSTVSRLVKPVSIGGGYLRAEDERTQTLHTFALSRVTAAVLEE